MPRTNDHSELPEVEVLDEGQTGKRCLAIIAFSLWGVSLVLPVFYEGGMAEGRAIRGYLVLFATFGYGVLAGFGIPWAAMNVGLVLLFINNLQGKTWRAAGWWFASGATLVTLLLVGVMALLSGSLWNSLRCYGVGVIPWTASMYLMAYATWLDGGPLHDK